jgi:hypothetical protein
LAGNKPSGRSKLSDYQLKGFALLYYAPKDFLGFMEPLCQCGRGSLLEGLLVKKKILDMAQRPRRGTEQPL